MIVERDQLSEIAVGQIISYLERAANTSELLVQFFVSQIGYVLWLVPQNSNFA